MNERELVILGLIFIIFLDRSTAWANGQGSILKLGDSESCAMLRKVQLEASHWWCTFGVRTAVILFNIFINDLDDWEKCTLSSSFANCWKLTSLVERLDEYATIQRNIHIMEELVNRNPIKFNKGNAESCIWRGIIPRSSAHWELMASFAGKALSCWHLNWTWTHFQQLLPMLYHCFYIKF